MYRPGFWTFFCGQWALLRSAWKGWREGQTGIPEAISLPASEPPGPNGMLCDERGHLGELQDAGQTDLYANLEAYHVEKGQLQRLREKREANERNAARKLVVVQERHREHKHGSLLESWLQWPLLILLWGFEAPMNYAAIEQLRVHRSMGLAMAAGVGVGVLYCAHAAGVLHRTPKDSKQPSEKYAEWTLLAATGLFTLVLAVLRHSAFAAHRHVSHSGTFFFLLSQAMLITLAFWLAYACADPVQTQRNACTRREKATRSVVAAMKAHQRQAQAIANEVISFYNLRRRVYISYNTRSRRKRFKGEKPVPYLPLALKPSSDLSEPIPDYTPPVDARVRTIVQQIDQEAA